VGGTSKKEEKQQVEIEWAQSLRHELEVHKAKINDQLATRNPSLACLLARQQQRGGFAHHQASLNVLEQWKLAQLLHQLLALPEGDLVRRSLQCR
jgi:hypothetical protein